MTDRLPLLLGEAPSKGGDAYYRFPLSGRPARVLCELAGIPPSEAEGATRYGRWTWELYERFECANLFRRYADATPWSVPVARDRAEELLRRRHLQGRAVVCLGRKVQAAVCSILGVDAGEPYYVWTTVSSTRRRPDSWVRVVTVPHPSGLNRLLNDPEERGRMAETLRRALDGQEPTP